MLSYESIIIENNEKSSVFYKFTAYDRREECQREGNDNDQNEINPISDERKGDKNVCDNHVINENAVGNV